MEINLENKKGNVLAINTQGEWPDKYGDYHINLRKFCDPGGKRTNFTGKKTNNEPNCVFNQAKDALEEIK